MDEIEANEAPQPMTLARAFEQQHAETEAYIAETLAKVEAFMRAELYPSTTKH